MGGGKRQKKEGKRTNLHCVLLMQVFHPDLAFAEAVSANPDRGERRRAGMIFCLVVVFVVVVAGFLRL